ncbi:MAG: isoprenylcysteine carboxylmethyltransferase family protein [Anaerolineae bacterium]
MRTLQWLGTLGAVVGLGTLAVAIGAMFRSVSRPAQYTEGHARSLLRIPVLGVFTVLFAGALVILWRPLPWAPAAWLRLALALAGLALIILGTGLYLWGLWTLGVSFAPSSGMGVRLQAGHRLVTDGPFAYMRHPMYLGVILTCVGTLPLYLTWASLALAVTMFGLVVRARREERVLEAQYGAEWRRYAARVPAWLPRCGQRDTQSQA